MDTLDVKHAQQLLVNTCQEQLQGNCTKNRNSTSPIFLVGDNDSTGTHAAMGNWGFIVRQLVLDRFQSLFYFVPQEKNITVKLARLIIV